MRALRVATSLSGFVALAFVAGCEDGPSQTFAPSPPGARLDDGYGTPPAVDSAARQPFAPDSGPGAVPGIDVIECTKQGGDKQVAAALRQPILPARFACGIDLAGDDHYTGITIEQVEKGYRRVDFLVDPRYPKSIDVMTPLANTTVGTAASLYKGNGPYDPRDLTQLCLGSDLGESVGSGGAERSIAWGKGHECVATYSVRTHKITSLRMNQGYQGAMTCYSRPKSRFELDGPHVYTVALGSRVLKDGEAVDFPADWWTTPPDPIAFFDELYDACVSTFAPFVTPQEGVLPHPDGTFAPLAGAIDEGRLSVGKGYVRFPAMGFGWSTDVSDVAMIPTTFDLHDVKTMAFSTADIALKLDAEGPVAIPPLKGKPTPCRVSMGVTFGDFVGTCVAVTGDETDDQSEINKLLLNKTNTRERYLLDLRGIGLSFSAMGLGPLDILNDGDYPAPEDIATELGWDGTALGKITNEYPKSDPSAGARDYHGGGLVWLEYARLAQRGLQKLRTDVCADAKQCPIGQAPERTLGDPACLGDNVKPASGGGFTYPQGCTGLEGFITSAPPPELVPVGEPYLDRVTLGVSGAASHSALKIGLGPGQPQIVVCNVLDGKTANHCTADTGGYSGPMFSGSFSRVLEVFAKNDIHSLPNEVRDGRFFFEQWFRALTKYLIAAGYGTENAAAVHMVALDGGGLFFAEDAGVLRGEYLDRRFAAKTGAPLELSATVDLKQDVVQGFRFGRATDRGERAVYDAMLDRGAPGSVLEGRADDVLLSNVVGSPVLQRVWGAKPQCATTGGTACIGAKAPSDPSGKVIVDEDGKPLLAPYAGAIRSTGPFAPGYHTVRCTPSVGSAPCDATTNINCCPRRAVLDPNGAPALDPSGNPIEIDVQVTTQVGSELVIEPLSFPLLSAKVTYPVRTLPFDDASYYQPVALGPDPGKSDGSLVYEMVPAYGGAPDQTANPTKTNVFLATYTARQPGTGFAIPFSPTLEKFITTARLDLSGPTFGLTLDIDDDPAPDPLSKQPVAGRTILKAVESRAFLGLVFLCRDPDTAEVLAVRSYDTGTSILDWINDHPAASAACDFVVRYSPYNGFLESVTSRQNGVTVGLAPAGGFRRVDSVTLWNPSLAY